MELLESKTLTTQKRTAVLSIFTTSSSILLLESSSSSSSENRDFPLYPASYIQQITFIILKLICGDPAVTFSLCSAASILW